ncbi:hypothetical protein VNO77_03696 [Canavalia gladiata]|uniref:Uncharacterized protein n=1 Tax=Canavalia gladiata TaxID=3824 RepID=A0AAN9R460_CANGL
MLSMVLTCQFSQAPLEWLLGNSWTLKEGPMQLDLYKRKKFGEMGECSAVCGGLLARVKDDEIERLRRYGRVVGVLHAVVDDILEERRKVKGGKGKRPHAEPIRALAQHVTRTLSTCGACPNSYGRSWNQT